VKFAIVHVAVPGGKAVYLERLDRPKFFALWTENEKQAQMFDDRESAMDIAKYITRNPSFGIDSVFLHVLDEKQYYIKYDKTNDAFYTETPIAGAHWVSKHQATKFDDNGYAQWVANFVKPGSVVVT